MVHKEYFNSLNEFDDRIVAVVVVVVVVVYFHDMIDYTIILINVHNMMKKKRTACSILVEQHNSLHECIAN